MQTFDNAEVQERFSQLADDVFTLFIEACHEELSELVINTLGRDPHADGNDIGEDTEYWNVYSLIVGRVFAQATVALYFPSQHWPLIKNNV